MSASNGTPTSQSRGQPLSEVFNEACAIFFRHCHNRPFCLFHPEVFRRNLVAQTIPIYLRFAIIASAVRYSPRSLWKDRKQKTIDSYAQYAWGQVVSLIGQGHDDIPIIQSLALLAIIDATAGRRQAAWVKIGIAVRISQDLLMMVEPESHLSDAEQDERRNLFWSLYLLDRFVCCAFRRPPAIRSSDCLLNLPRDDGSGSSNPPTTLKELLDQESGIKRLQPGAFGLSIGLAAVLGDTVDYMMRDEVGHAPWHADAPYNVIQNKLEYLNELTTIHGNSVASLEEPPTQAELNPHDRRQVTHLVLSHTLYHLAHCILKHPFLLGAKLQLHGVQDLPSPWMEETRRSCLAHACSLTQVLVDAQAAGYMLVPSFYSYCVLVAGTIHGLYLYGGDAPTSDTASKNIARSLAYLSQISEVWDPAQMIADVLRFFTNRCVRYSNVLLHQKLRMQELTDTDMTVLRLVLDFWAMMDPKNPVTELSSLNIDCFADLSAVDREISTSASPDSADQYATQINILSFSETGPDGCVDPNILFDRQPSRQSPADDPAHWDWDKEIDALEFTPTWHNDTYAAISPLRPELSAEGKTIVVTGAGSGIGRQVALSFAQAGARKIALLGRTESKLRETQTLLACESAVYAVSVTDDQGIQEAAAAIGTWDVLVVNAGYLTAPATIADSPVEDWWQSFETNVKGAMICTKRFQPTAHPTRAAVIGMTAGMMLPPSMIAGLSAYMSSKIAAVKVLEFFGAENPGIFVASVLPGIMETEMFNKSNLPADQLPLDDIHLPADFTVWLSSPEASFLDGRQVWAHWDVEELQARKDEITSGTLLTAGIHGWPHPYGNRMDPSLLG